MSDVVFSIRRYVILLACIVWISIATQIQAQFPGGGGMPSAPRSSPPGGGYRPPSAPNYGQSNRNNPGSFQPGVPGVNNQTGLPGNNGYPQNSLRPGSPGYSPYQNPGNPVGGQFRNPFSAPPQNINGAPGGISPNSNRFFPRPAVPVPSTFRNVYAGLPGNPSGQWSQAGQLISAGQTTQAQQLIEQRLQGQRTLENLMGAIGSLQQAPSAGSLMSGYRTEAMTMARNQIQAGTTTPLPFVALAKFSLETGNDAEFRTSTAAMMNRFPNDKHSHFFYGLQQLKDHNYQSAEAALKKAEALGIPRESINEYLKLAIDGQKWVWEYAQIALVALVAWAVGLILIVSVGRILSALSLRSAAKALEDGRSKVTAVERALRIAYRWTIGIAGLYYYVSLPMVVVLAISLPLTIGYALLMLPSLSIILIGIVLLAGIGGIITGISGIRALFLRANSNEDPGRSITEQDAPELWKMVRDVAQQLNTRPIDEIWMTPGTTVAVIERGSYLQRMRDNGKRSLILGAAVMDDFGQHAFRSVLAHEYGHFVNRDTAGGDVAMRVQASMYAFADRIVARGRIRKWDVAIHFLSFYHRMFTRLSFGASRLQEIQADRRAVSKFGASAFIEGLTHVIRRSVEFDAHIGLVLQSRIRQTSGAVGFYKADQAFTTDDHRSIDAAIEEVLARPTTSNDTHPSPKDRFQLAKRIDPTVSESNGHVIWNLFRRPDQLRQEMSGRLHEHVENEAVETRVILNLMLQRLDHLAGRHRDPQALMERASLYSRLGDFKRMKKDLEILAEKQPASIEVQYGLSVAYEHVGQYPEAVEALSKVMKLDGSLKTEFDVVYRLGQLQAAAGHSTVACHTFSQAIKIKSNEYVAYVARAKTYLASGQPDLAEQDFRKALSLSPECGDAKKGLAELAGIVVRPETAEHSKDDC
jgi:Zn-dependent protease with chaperone function